MVAYARCTTPQRVTRKSDPFIATMETPISIVEKMGMMVKRAERKAHRIYEGRARLQIKGVVLNRPQKPTAQTIVTCRARHQLPL
jgi:hypothetical protein